ncbi:Intraflagellar transport protein 57 [Phlyctochytrium bullatum]|nr:Intraflagellar transport protein 57 [Phlyctochytrium bullatum]
MGVPFEYGPHKLKQGHGEAIIYTLQILTDRALQLSGFTFQKPVHKVDDYPEEAEVDIDAEITLDQMEERIGADDDEDEVYMESIRPIQKTEEVKAQVVIKPSVDPAEWKLEVERVTPMLKVQVSNDNKDWRIHVEQMNIHQKLIGSSLHETKDRLNKLQQEIEKTLEKISSREKYINAQFEHQVEEQRALQDQLSELRQKYNVSNSNVTELSNELARISEELDAVKVTEVEQAKDL